MPPVPVYVTNTVAESEEASTPVILVAVMPGSTDVSTGVVANVSPAVLGGGGHCPGAAELVVLRLAMFRSVSVAVGVAVTPIACLPLFVVVSRSVAGPVTPASG